MYILFQHALYERKYGIPHSHSKYHLVTEIKGRMNESLIFHNLINISVQLYHSSYTESSLHMFLSELSSYPCEANVNLTEALGPALMAQINLQSNHQTSIQTQSFLFLFSSDYSTISLWIFLCLMYQELL